MQNHLRIHCLPCAALLLLGERCPPSLFPLPYPQLCPESPVKGDKSSAYVEDFFILTKVTVVYSEFGENDLPCYHIDRRHFHSCF